MVNDTCRRGYWFQSLKGRRIYPLDPHPEDVDVEEIAHVLSRICRYGGHVPGKFPYSVAQHSIYVQQCVGEANPEWKLLGLLHDTPEAYLGDVIRPIKRSPLVSEEYALMEDRWMQVICEALDVPLVLPFPEPVKVADNRVLMAERRDLLVPGPAWQQATLEEGGRGAWEGRVVLVEDPDFVRESFLQCYYNLKREQREAKERATRAREVSDDDRR